MAKFIIKLNNNVVDHVELGQGDVKIGRKAGCEPPRQSFGQRRARQHLHHRRGFLRPDLGSTNGTYVNNKKITKHHLKDGDSIAVGKYILVYLNEAAKETSAFAKTVAITGPASDTRPAPAAKPPAAAAKAPGQGTLITLSGSTPGKRIEFAKTVTNLGKAGKRSGSITRMPDGYHLAAGEGEVPKLNGRAISGKNVKLRNGDIIGEVAGTRLQFHLK